MIGLPENPPLLETTFHAHFGSQDVELVRPVIYRYIDRVQGELTRPLIVEPPVVVELPDRARMFPDRSPKPVDVQVRANVKGTSGDLSLNAPPGWQVEPRSQSFHLADLDQQAVLTFRVSPSPQDAKGPLRGSAKVGDRNVDVGMDVIAYPHIPTQVLFHPAETTLVRAGIRNLAKTVGYVMGAGDELPESLRQIGSEVVLLSADDLARGDLTRFDAIVTGVRAYNTRPDLRANQQRVLEYVKTGGTMVVQYNVLEGGFTAGDPSLLAMIGPYPITVGRERVTVEEAPVAFPNPPNPLLHQPNEITEKDFEGWVQERGLYFGSTWDSHYQPLFETHDPGQKPQLGGTLYAKYGKGVYIFTAFSWFRELPTGVPGAYRIFANFISASPAQQPHPSTTN
jgi:hypothetical protein